MTADRDASVQDLASKMRDESVGSIVVVDDGDPVTIVTAGTSRSPSPTAASRTRPPVTCYDPD